MNNIIIYIETEGGKIAGNIMDQAVERAAKPAKMEAK